MGVRKAMFAGSWYPGSAGACEKEIRQFLGESDVQKNLEGDFIGGIVPHAGWYFSGSIACNVIHCLQSEKQPDVIVVFGMHLSPGSSTYIMTDGSWETPFGEIEIERELAVSLSERFNFNIETSEDYTQDNTIELQLPFIKYFFSNTKIIPIGVPPTESSLQIGEAVADLSKQLGLSVKVIGSTDLTHYGYNYGFIPEGTGKKAHEWVRKNNDRKVIDAMLNLDPIKVIHEALENQNACCSGAAATAIAAGKALGASQAQITTYATSYEKSPGDSFVGYVGIMF